MLLVSAAGALIYPRISGDDKSVTEITQSIETALPPVDSSGTTALSTPAPTTDGGLAASGIEFLWPGGDCWDIFQGTELVTSKCGATKQALRAGRYTIKGKYAPVFVPFELNIQPGKPTRVTQGGVFDFAWPGADCWDILRGSELVISQCGATKQALSAGRYTIKSKYAPVFAPITVDIKDGSSMRRAMGGVFEFAWPGADCWDILRGSELVITQCGAAKQALAAGRYTIKGKYAPVFAPVTVDIKDGSLTRRAMGGVFEFAWPGADCWDIFRGSELVITRCGAAKQALGAGRYTIKGKYASVFDPFEITVTDGRTVVKRS